MKEFDPKRIDTALIYIARMAEGRNPANNRPVSNEVLDNPNVIRCLHFVEEVLQEVKENHGIVGKKYQHPRSDFPVEALEKFEYRRDKPISHVLKQFAEAIPDEHVKGLNPAAINKWLATQGYLEKQKLPGSEKESWAPTVLGREKGLYAETRGEAGREYISVMYNKEGQYFLADCVRQILEAKQNKEAESSPN